MLKGLFEDQRKYLNQFFDQIDTAQADRVLEKLFSCSGTVILCGVGKSGHIAEKLAATFSSTGTRAFFLNPNNALHGDIGFIGPQDVVLLLSKSGNTQELVDLVPHIRRKKALVIAVVSAPRSKLEQMADFTVLLPIEKEICPYNLAPTTSTAAQLIFGDCVAIALMKRKHFSMHDFAANHPGGVLGRKISLRIADLMLKGEKLPCCRPQDTLLEVLHELSNKRCGCLLVMEKSGVLRGIFTDGDLRRAIETKGPQALHLSLEQLMTACPKSIAPNQLAIEAVRLMEENRAHPITVLPVLEQGKVVGLVRMHDILQKEIS